MQNTKDIQFEPLGVCHRLFNFIMNGIIGRGLKRVTLGQPLSRGSTEVPVEGSSLSSGVDSIEETLINSIHPNGEEMLQLHPDNEIVVEFRNNNGLEFWNTPNDNLGSSVNGTDENEPVLSIDHTQLQRGNDDHKEIENKERANYEAIGSNEIPNLIQEIGLVSNNGTSIEAKVSQDVEEEQVLSTSIGARTKGQKKEKKDKYIAKEGLTLAIEPEQAKPKPPIHHRPFLRSVIANINEKSDEFIRKRKEAMTRNYSHIEPKSS